MECRRQVPDLKRRMPHRSCLSHPDHRCAVPERRRPTVAGPRLHVAHQGERPGRLRHLSDATG